MQVEDLTVESFDVKDIKDISFSNDPLQRYSFLKDKIKTTLYEQKHNAEILTPDNIVDEMIQKLVELYTLNEIKQWKIIEPCCGKGAFLIGLYKIGVPLENLHWNDFNQSNVSFCDLLFNQKKGTCKNALEIDYTKYDLVITNPPYNKVSDIIFDKFIFAFSKAKLNYVIVPNKWTTMKKLQKLKDYFQNHLLFYEQRTNIFKQNTGTISICLSQLEEVKDSKYNFNKSYNNLKPIDGEHFTLRKFSKKELWTQFYKEEVFENSVKCYTNRQIGGERRYMYVSKDQLKHVEDINKWKIIYFKNEGNGGDGCKSFKLIEPNEIFNSSYSGLFVDSKQEGLELLKKLQSEDIQNQIKQRNTRCISSEIIKTLQI